MKRKDFTFYLGVHRPSFMAKTSVPLFVSRRQLEHMVCLPRARGPWCLDSAAFTELSLYGGWRTPTWTYVRQARRFRDRIGNMVWCASMDYMCEPFILAKTGLTVRRHQELTIDKLRELEGQAPDLPFVPVLQGWAIGDYLRHLEMYFDAGVDLATKPAVGIGSVCRRQSTAEVTEIIQALYESGLRNLHGFGMKQGGLLNAAHLLASSDSMAWSFRARHRPPLPGCDHRNCANCLRFALKWQEDLLATIAANN